MRINLRPVAVQIQHIYPVLLRGIRVFIVACLVATGAYCCLALSRLPAHPLTKLVLSGFALAIAGGCAWLILVTEPLLVAKLALVAAMIAGTIGCLVALSRVGHWHETLDRIQAECDLAANCTYLWGEMTRHQLETLNTRIRHAIEPEEREITETVIKTISPFVILYFRKEKSIIKWSLAAAGIGKDLLKYFFRPGKHS